MINATLNQVILYVRDMPSALRFYRDVLGLAVIYPEVLSDDANQVWVELDAGACTLALHSGAQHLPGDEHELIFKVKDLEAARQSLLSAGVEMGAIRLLEDGLPIASGVDPSGHRFSIR